MQWVWSGADVVLAVATTIVGVVTTFTSLLVSTVAAVLVALWIQRREFNRETAQRWRERDEERSEALVSWRHRMADEAILFCTQIQEAALSPGNGYLAIKVDRWLDAFQNRLRISEDSGSDHVAIAMRRDWRAAFAVESAPYDLDDREEAINRFIRPLQDDLRRWAVGEMPTSAWAARGIGG